jgi:hypothetical protein
VLRTERPAGYIVRKLRKTARGHMAPPLLAPPYRLASGLSAAHILMRELSDGGSATSHTSCALAAILPT